MRHLSSELAERRFESLADIVQNILATGIVGVIPIALATANAVTVVMNAQTHRP